MKFRWLLVLLTLLAANAQALQPSIEIIEQLDDLKLVAFVDEKNLENYPLWINLEENPPLQINRAIRAIQDLYNKNGNKLNSSGIKEIELKEIPHHKNYWHYIIRVEGNSENRSIDQVYVILMNGKVIPALIETESYK